MTTLATEPSKSTSSDAPPGDREIPLAPKASAEAAAPRASTSVSDRLGYSVNVDLAKLAAQPAPTPGPRLMPRSGPLDAEPFWKRALYILLMLAILGGFAYMLKCFFAPAHAGINQNAYLVGGKNLAEYGTMGVKLKNNYEYLGWMWNLVDHDPDPKKEDIWFYPKYPLGTGALFAAALQISKWINHGDWDPGKLWAFYVNPVSCVLCVAAVFMLTRQVAGSYAAVCGALIMASCQVMLAYAEQPLSHGPALACVSWGMYFLYRYWQTASSWRGILAGLLLGYAVTIRYTEGLLILPIAATLISMVRYDVRATRWWTLGAWLAIAIAGVICFGEGVIPFKQMSAPSYAIFATLMLVFAVIPVLLDRNVVETLSAGDTSPIRGNSRTRRWIKVGFHTLRTIIAAGLVWIAVFFDKPAAFGPAAVDRMVQIVGIKAALIGALALLYLVPWNQPRRYLKLAIPALAWLVPTGTLLAYNYLAMGSFSGYDTTHESTAFTWRTFTQKWDDTVQQIYDYSMFMIPPLAIAGMILMYRWNWRAALLITLWFIPGMALYIAYYFGQQRPGYWYLRFFLTLFPAMIVPAMWLLKSAAEGMAHHFGAVPATMAAARERIGRARGSVAVPLGIGIFTYCSCAIGLSIAVPLLEREHASSINLAYTSDQIVNTIKVAQKKAPKVYINDKLAKPVVFAEGRGNPNAPLCNFLQFWGDFELYPSDGFSGGAGLTGFRDAANNQPNPMQPARQDYFNNFFRTRNEAQTAKDQNKIMSDALEEGRLVFAALQPSAASFFRNRFVTPGGFDMRLVAQWREPAKVPMERSSSQLDPLARGMPMNPVRASQTFQLYQITRKPPAPPAPPAPKGATPTTVPATAPAVPTTQPQTAKKFAVVPPSPPTTSPSNEKPANILSVLQTMHMPGFWAQPTTKPSK